MKKGLLAAVCLALWGAPPARAIVPNLPVANVPGIGQVGSITGGNFVINGTGVAISPTWILTASHVGGDKFVQNGTTYQIVQTVNHPTADLSLRRVVGPFQFAMPMKLDYFPGGVPASQTNLPGEIAKIQGFGWTGNRTSTGFSTITGTQGTLRQCRNKLDLFMPNVTIDLGGGNTKTTDYIFYDLDDPLQQSTVNTLGGGPVIPDEGGMNQHDSGCPWTLFEHGRERVVGIGGIIGFFQGSGVTRALDWGGFGAAALLQKYSAWIAVNASDVGRAILNPPTFSLGQLQSGTVNDLYLTDNLGITTVTDTRSVDTLDTMIMHMIGTTTASPANSLQLVFKGRANSSLANCLIDLRNVTTGQYENVGGFALRKTDVTTTVTISNPNAYVWTDGVIDMRMRVASLGEDQFRFRTFWDVIRMNAQ